MIREKEVSMLQTRNQFYVSYILFGASIGFVFGFILSIYLANGATGQMIGAYGGLIIGGILGFVLAYIKRDNISNNIGKTSLDLIRYSVIFQGIFNLLLGITLTFPIGFTPDYYLMYFGYMWTLASLYLFISLYPIKRMQLWAIGSVINFFIAFSIGCIVALLNSRGIYSNELVLLLAPGFVIIILSLYIFIRLSSQHRNSPEALPRV